MTARKVSRPPARAALVKAAVAALEDMKAAHIKVMDVRKVTDVADCMVLASGNSDRHVRSIADRVVERARAAGFRPMGVEGEREFYGLEELWEAVPQRPKTKPRKARAKAPAKARGKASRGARKPAGKAGSSRKPARPGSRPRG
jgi:ribosomal silencing factor RsfS